MGKELQRRLGIDYLHANELDIRGGVATGEVVTEIVDGTKKAEYLRQIAEAENLMLEQVIAVGDGANDLPMLSIAGLGIAFRAKPLVRKKRSTVDIYARLGWHFVSARRPRSRTPGVSHIIFIGCQRPRASSPAP